MINSNIYLAPECLGAMQLVAVTPIYYANGVRQETVQGIVYDVLLPEHKYDRLRITIPGIEPLIAEPAVSDIVMVTVDDLRVKPYVRDGRLAFAATASGIRTIHNPLADTKVTKDKA